MASQQLYVVLEAKAMQLLLNNETTNNPKGNQIKR